MSAGQRIVIQLADESGGGGELPHDAQGVLATAGTFEAKPDSVLPGVFVVTVPPDVDVDQLVARLSALPIIRHAEPELFREASSLD